MPAEWSDGIAPEIQVKAGYLAPGLMGIYVVFLCWSAIRRRDRDPEPETLNNATDCMFASQSCPFHSKIYFLFSCRFSEPHTEICNKKAAVATSADWVNIAVELLALFGD